MLEENYQPHGLERKAQSFGMTTTVLLLQRIATKRSSTVYQCSRIKWPPAWDTCATTPLAMLFHAISARQKCHATNGLGLFGLPAENAAIKNKTAPAPWTYENIEYMKAS